MNRPFVLIIDDEPQTADAARFVLRRSGFDAYAAYAPEEGFELAFELEPDVILLDVAMPRLNGLEILRLLKGSFMTAHIPVILISGKEWFDCAGMFTCVMKPFDSVGLVSAIRNALAGSREPEFLLPSAA